MKAIKACLPALATLIQHSDKEVLADTCWALSYITDGANNQIQEVVDMPGIHFMIFINAFDFFESICIISNGQAS